MEKPRKYQVGQNVRGRSIIRIHRKPSEIPYHIDQELTVLGCWVYLDGPNDMVTYEFLLPSKLESAEEYLKNSMWEKDSEPVQDGFGSSYT